MSNLTISVDERYIKQARVRAIQEGTSLSARVREFIAAYAAGTTQPLDGDPTDHLMRMITEVRAQLQQPDAEDEQLPRKTLREEMYEGDFRARARLEAQQERERGSPKAP
ncbi:MULTISPECIES: DUF6364 family protein [Hydrogenophaga]|uniref:DUF6364 family protein n=2 Tax=Hydrogenophaga TaxID=47420 RepID=A0ABW2QKW2_9BURK